MVASYLVHHSYCATAEAFAKSTDQAVHEELASIKNRQSESGGHTPNWDPDNVHIVTYTSILSSQNPKHALLASAGLVGVSDFGVLAE